MPTKNLGRLFLAGFLPALLLTLSVGAVAGWWHWDQSIDLAFIAP
jgi:TRAP-type C4-dicarboxylate transport system permease large subunit